MVTALHHFAHVHVGMGEGMRTYVAHLVMASLTYPHVYMYVCMCVCVFAYVSTQASSIKDRSFSWEHGRETQVQISLQAYSSLQATC
jgi:hypothetical protein